MITSRHIPPNSFWGLTKQVGPWRTTTVDLAHEANGYDSPHNQVQEVRPYQQDGSAAPNYSVPAILQPERIEDFRGVGLQRERTGQGLGERLATLFKDLQDEQAPRFSITPGKQSDDQGGQGGQGQEGLQDRFAALLPKKEPGIKKEPEGLELGMGIIGFPDITQIFPSLPWSFPRRRAQGATPNPDNLPPMTQIENPTSLDASRAPNIHAVVPTDRIFPKTPFETDPATPTFPDIPADASNADRTFPRIITKKDTSTGMPRTRDRRSRSPRQGAFTQPGPQIDQIVPVLQPGPQIDQIVPVLFPNAPTVSSPVEMMEVDKFAFEMVQDTRSSSAGSARSASLVSSRASDVVMHPQDRVNALPTIQTRLATLQPENLPAITTLNINQGPHQSVGKGKNRMKKRKSSTSSFGGSRGSFNSGTEGDDPNDLTFSPNEFSPSVLRSPTSPVTLRKRTTRRKSGD
jgi:hypothetical protein